MKKVAALALAVTILVSPISIGKAYAMSEPIMKVKLQNYVGNQSSITFKTNSDYKISDQITTIKANTVYSLKLMNGVMSLYNGTTFIKSFTDFTAVSPKREALITIGGKVYRGSMEFTIENKQSIRPINFIPLEDYIRGVIAQEMSYTWNPEALKSQAVAARTFALSYDTKVINDTTSYQTYDGINYITSIVGAIQATTGQALLYNGNYIDAVYSSSNGGYIESSMGAWGIQYPYLTAKQDLFDPVNTFTFTKTESNLLSNSSLVAKMKTQNGNKYIADVNSIALNGSTDGKRPKYVVLNITNLDGTISNVSIATGEFRTMMGSSVMKSTYINVPVKQNGSFVFTGKGYGHGVGMSQYGAEKRAETGQNYQTILSFYYPGAKLVKQY